MRGGGSTEGVSSLASSPRPIPALAGSGTPGGRSDHLKIRRPWSKQWGPPQVDDVDAKVASVLYLVLSVYDEYHAFC